MHVFATEIIYRPVGLSGRMRVQKGTRLNPVEQYSILPCDHQGHVHPRWEGIVVTVDGDRFFSRGRLDARHWPVVNIIGPWYDTEHACQATSAGYRFRSEDAHGKAGVWDSYQRDFYDVGGAGSLKTLRASIACCYLNHNYDIECGLLDQVPVSTNRIMKWLTPVKESK